MCRVLVTIRDFLSKDAFTPIHILEDGQEFGSMEGPPDFGVIEMPGVSRSEVSYLTDNYRQQELDAIASGRQFVFDEKEAKEFILDGLSVAQKTALRQTGRLLGVTKAAIDQARVYRQPRPVSQKTILTREQAIAALRS